MTPTAIVPADAPNAVERAARLLREGRLVAFPTDTVYAVGADATNEAAIMALFALKGRPESKPLIVLCASFEEAVRYAAFDQRARRVAERFWPGPLSLVLRRAEGSALAQALSGGTGTIALRVPGRALTLALLEAAARPLAAPSANRTDEPTPNTAEGVARAFDAALALVLDGGPSPSVRPSTLLDLSAAHPKLIREGPIGRDRLEPLTGPLAGA